MNPSGSPAGDARYIYYEIELSLAEFESDAVEESLNAAGASAITLVDRGDQPVLEPLPGEVRLWTDTLVKALFLATIDPAQVLDRLAKDFGPVIVDRARVRAVEERDWERAWLDDWHAMQFGRRLWVCPIASAPPGDPDAVVVRLDPGLAFGTGTHPTTALCLQVLDSLPLAGRRVIDYGCGSGILGIAALKLGGAHVTAVDLDPQALLATRENAKRNGVSPSIDVQGIHLPLTAASCVVANILLGPLIDLAPLLRDACEPGADLLLSGLLKTQTNMVKAAYASGFALVEVLGRDDWCCIHFRRAA